MHEGWQAVCRNYNLVSCLCIVADGYKKQDKKENLSSFKQPVKMNALMAFLGCVHFSDNDNNARPQVSPTSPPIVVQMPSVVSTPDGK